MHSRVYGRQQSYPASNTSRGGRGNYNYPGGNRNLNYKYQAQRYQDSSLAMCWDVARDLAIGAYDYAEPKVIKGITTVKQLEIKGPQCGAAAVQRGRSRKKKRNARAGSKDSSSSTSRSDTGTCDDTIEDNPTLLTHSSSDTKTACSSDASERSLRPSRPVKGRGRSPTFRSKSVNAADRKEELDGLQMNPDNYIMMGPRRVVVADPQLHSYRQMQGDAENGTILKRGFYRQSSSGVDKEQHSPKKDPLGREGKADAYAIMNRMMTECAVVGMPDVLPLPDGMLSPPPFMVHATRTSSNYRNSPVDSEEYMYDHPTGYSPDSSRDPTASPTQVPSLAQHKDQGTDVKIVVGRGPKQEIFLHNSHVLLYISEHFSQVMEPNTSSSGQDTASWIIDFSHRKVKEWKLFYPFLEPPVKRKVSIDNRNLPTLLPWFHRFQLPLLLHQCDNILSSLYFRPPPVERAEISSATFSDLQDVLLMLYAGLSCDLPQTQELGIRVIETYLKEAPFLFYSVSNGSVMRRLIILLQCFPHFQQQLWESVIRANLPADLVTCCDTETTDGRDNLFQNPLFPLLLREGLTKSKVKARNRQYLRTKHEQQLQQRQGHSHSGATTVADDYSLEANSILTGSSSLNGMNRATSASSPFLEELSQRQSMLMLRSGHLVRESPTAHFSRQTQTAHFNRQQHMEKQTITNAEEEQGDDFAFLEMSIELGEQFWGSGWHEEPRFSIEKHKRQRDRRRWLEDIVHQLKSHARQEEEQPMRNESESRNDSLPQEYSTVVSEENVQTQEEVKAQGVTDGGNTQDGTAIRRGSPSDGSDTPVSVLDATAPRKFRGRIGVQRRNGNQPPSPISDDNRTTTTDTNSLLSGGSAHTAEDNKSSDGHSI